MSRPPRNPARRKRTTPAKRVGEVTPGAARVLAKLAQDTELLANRQAERIARQRKLPPSSKSQRPAILDELDPEGRYGTGTGARFSEVDPEARLVTQGASIAAEVTHWLRTNPGTDAYPLPRSDARILPTVLSLLSRTYRGLQDHKRRVAMARLVITHAKGNPATKLRRALSWLVDVETTGRLNARRIVDDYATLTQSRGTVSMWNDIERALDLPGYVVEGCPMSPSRAVDILIERHRFKSRIACLRYLHRQREAAVEADRRDADLVEFGRLVGDDLPIDPSWIAQALKNLPQER